MPQFVKDDFDDHGFTVQYVGGEVYIDFFSDEKSANEDNAAPERTVVVPKQRFIEALEEEGVL